MDLLVEAYSLDSVSYPEPVTVAEHVAKVASVPCTWGDVKSLYR